MKKTSRRLFAARVLLMISAGCLLLAVIFMTIAMLRDLEAGTNYFVRGAYIPTIAVVAAIVGGVCGGAAILLLPASRLAGYSPLDAGVFSGIPAAVGFAVLGVCSVFFADGAFRILFPLLSVLSAAYLLWSGAFSGKNGHAPGLFPLLGAAPVIACILWVAYSYFDLSVEMNAPVKVPVQVALLLAMLCFTEELRFPLGRPMPRFYLLLCVLSVSAASLTAAAFPVAFFLKKIPLCYFAGAMVSFGAALTGLMRLAPLISESSASGKSPTLPADDTAASESNEASAENDTEGDAQ